MKTPALSYTALLLSAVLLAAGCDSPSESELPVETRARPAKIYTLVTAENHVMRSYPATLEASNKSNLAFRVSGQLLELPARASVRVKKGDLLAKLESSDYQNALDVRSASYKLAKVQYNQAKKLRAKKIASQLQLDKALASLSSSKANLTQAENNLRYTALRAPFDGIIAQVSIDNHQAIQAGVPILQLQTSEQLDVSFSIPESLMSQIGSIEPELFAAICGDVYFSNRPNESYNACYKEHELVPDRLTRNYKVLFSIDAPKTFTALPGMSANIVLDLSSLVANTLKTALVAPIESIHEYEGGSWVWRVTDDMRAEHVQVELGPLGDKGFEIVQGLSHGDKLVAAGLSYIRQSMLLKPLTKERGL